MTITDEEYKQALTVASSAPVNPTDALNLIAVLVDGAWDRRDLRGADRALELGAELLDPQRYATLDRRGKAYLHYCLANAWDGKEHLSPDAPQRAWDWQAKPREHQILHLRTALAEGGDDLEAEVRVRVLTNLANALDRVGRVVEAIEVYDHAKTLAPGYGMPAANRGVALKEYAHCVSDPGHAYFILHHAVQSMEAALALPFDGDEMREQFTAVLAAARKTLGGWKLPTCTFTLGRSKAERTYRTWALRERLFLNPLNDLGELAIAAHDPLCPISIVTKVGEGPSHFGFLNAMKQEYASARFVLFQGLHREGVHYSDREVKIVNTMDYPVHRLGMEEVKIAFRLAYSLLDKIAVFLNQYFDLGHDAKKVHFRNVWFEPPQCRVLHPALASRPNWPLRGLFWISKDIFEIRDEHRRVLEPDARELADLRNHMEHKHLRVVEHLSADGQTASPFQDLNSRVVAQDDLERKSLRVLKLARASLIHLVNAVTVEERVRSRARDGQVTAPMFLTDWEDGWKR